MSKSFFDRGDFRATRLLVFLAAAVVPVVQLALPVARWVVGSPLRATVDAADLLPAPDGVVAERGAAVRTAGLLAVRLDDAPPGTWLASLLPAFVVSVATVLVCVLLLRLVRRIERGDSFDRASVTALRWVGATIVVGGALLTLATAVADTTLLSATVSQGVHPGIVFQLPFGYFVAGMLVLALAEAFAQGVRLQDDLEGVI